MFARLERRHILLIACGIALLVTPIFEIIAPGDADDSTRLLLGLRTFLAMSVVLYFVILSQRGMDGTRLSEAEAFRPSLGAVIRLSLRTIFPFALMPAAAVFIEGETWTEIAKALVFSIVPAFLLGFLIFGAFMLWARQLHPPKG